MLSKFETLGYERFACVFFVAVISLSANAKDSGTSPNTDGMGAAFATCENKTGADKDSCLADLQKFSDSLGGNGDRASCKKTASDFGKNYGKFTGACQNLGLPTDTASSCKDELRKCEGTSDDDDKKSNKACLSQGADVKKYEEEAQKLKDEINTAKDKLTDVDQQEAKINQQLQKTISQAQDKIDQEDRQYRQQLADSQNKFQDQLTQAQRQKQQHINELKAAYDKMDADISNYAVQKAQAKLTSYSQTVAKLDDDCETEATEAENKQIDQDIQDEKAGTRRVGSGGALASMAHMSGPDDYQRYETKAQTLYNRCINKGSYKRQSKLALQQFLISARQADSQIVAVQKAQLENIKEQNQTRRDADLDQNKAYMAEQRTEAAMQANITSERQSMENQVQNEKNGDVTQIQALEKQRQTQQSSISDKQAYLDKKLQVLKDKEAAANGRDYTAEEASKVTDAFGDAHGSAMDLASCCSGTNPAYTGTMCDTAKQFLGPDFNESSAGSGPKLTVDNDGNSSVTSGDAQSRSTASEAQQGPGPNTVDTSEGSPAAQEGKVAP